MADKECPNCGRKTREEASFCLGCGHSFGAAVKPRAAPERRPPPAERPAPEREAPPDRYEPERRPRPADEYVPRPPASGKRLTIEQRRDMARRRTEADDRARADAPKRRFRPQRIEVALALAMLPTTVLLSIFAYLFIINVVDWLKPDEGVDAAEFVASGDFTAGRLLRIGMTQNEIDTTTFEGVAGWRVVYLEEASAADATVSAGDVHLTTKGASPVSSPYYMTVAFPKAGAVAAPVAAFLRRDEATVFHVMSISCEHAMAILADTTRRGPPPGSIC